jgi:hypothetical protein
VKRFLFAALTLLPLAAVAEDGWINITTSNQGEAFAIKAGSVSIDKNNKGLLVVHGTIRDIKPDGTYEFGLFAFDLEACASGMGQMVIANTSGQVTATLDFVTNGGNVVSQVFDDVCSALKAAAQAKKQPSSNL